MLVYVGWLRRPTLGSLGPFTVLQSRRWGRFRYYVDAGDDVVRVMKYGYPDSFDAWGRWWEVFFRDPMAREKVRYLGEDDLNKYIKAAENAASGNGTRFQVEDEWLFSKRPALREYMTSLEAAGGGVREASVLMVCVGDDGFRVGIKDEDQGGWLWRVGEKYSEALNALEQALASGKARFGGARKKGPAKAR